MDKTFKLPITAQAIKTCIREWNRGASRYGYLWWIYERLLTTKTILGKCDSNFFEGWQIGIRKWLHLKYWEKIVLDLVLWWCNWGLVKISKKNLLFISWENYENKWANYY